MAPPKSDKPDALATELEQLRAENARLAAQLAAAKAEPVSEPRAAPLAPVVGKKTFRLTERHYRAGQMFEAGDLITIENEVPGRSWQPYDPEAVTPAPVPEVTPASVVRAADAVI
jgi:hypothetical protein